MTMEKKIAAVFGMDAEAWLRHANPWSVWTRCTVLPVIVLALWSRAWLGWWALAPTAAAVFWAWLNPRLFPKPRSTDNWASKGVLGERVWMNRRDVPIPERHRTLPNVLSAVSVAGAVPVVWGVVAFDLWPTLLGAAAIYLSKFWFLDRMVWLYEDMKDATPEYRSWLY